jgi:quercetin dioxygenase-like cupin family protein
MQIPDFLMTLPALDLPLDASIVETRAMKSENRLIVFFIAHQEAEIPLHKHKAQWGTILQGEFHFVMEGETRICRQGDSYSIPEGAEHGGILKAGTIALDIFEEVDRYPYKS